jgi:hypothetical protein
VLLWPPTDGKYACVYLEEGRRGFHAIVESGDNRRLVSNNEPGKSCGHAMRQLLKILERKSGDRAHTKAEDSRSATRIVSTSLLGMSLKKECKDRAFV